MRPEEKAVLVRVTIVAAAILGFSQFAEWTDQRWGALAVALMFNPSTNLLLAVIAAMMVASRSVGSPVRAKIGYPTALLVPLVGVVVNFFSLGLMSTHGC